MSVRLNRCSSGAGLIEVLIAVLIFTSGALGLAGMQLVAKRITYEATQRTIATSLARDILERMRGNAGELAAYVVSDLGAAPYLAGANCMLQPCSPRQLAQSDIREWNALLSGYTELVTTDGLVIPGGGLVDPRACISSSGGKVQVAIAWRGALELANSTRSACGESSGRYGTENELRRLLVMTTYVESS
jgi:type IV pilus assembly protein PilV